MLAATTHNDELPMTRTHTSQATVLRRLLILVFLTGGLMYSVSLLEYTLFHLTGWSPWPVETRYATLSREQWHAEIERCQSPLFASSGTTTAEAGLPIRARCGRFWPFYYHQIEVPASSWIPGAFVDYDGETEADRLARENFIHRMRVIHGGFALVALFVLGMALRALWFWARTRDEEAAYRSGFQAFVSSFLMVAAFTGLMFFNDPTFGLGW